MTTLDTVKARKRAYHKEWKARNREKARKHNRESMRRWRAAHPKLATQRVRDWFQANQDKVSEYRRRWNERYPERRQAVLAANRDRYKVNGHRYSVAMARRYASKLKAIHAGHDHIQERALYLECRRLEEAVGTPHHVDHIIPLSLGGWHHHENMQILPGSVNQSKSDNPFWEMPGYKSWRDVPECLWPDSLATEYRARIMNAVSA